MGPIKTEQDNDKVENRVIDNGIDHFTNVKAIFLSIQIGAPPPRSGPAFFAGCARKRAGTEYN
jgi:hypothetical protein